MGTELIFFAWATRFLPQCRQIGSFPTKQEHFLSQTHIWRVEWWPPNPAQRGFRVQVVFVQLRRSRPPGWLIIALPWPSAAHVAFYSHWLHASVCYLDVTVGSAQSSGAVWKSRWPSWAFRPNEPYGVCGRKATLNPVSALVTVCL